MSDKTVKEPKAKPVKPVVHCGCGCGGTPKRGNFLPGHDAKHKSALGKKYLAGDAAAGEELQKNGWPLPQPKPEKPKAKKAAAKKSDE